MTMVHEVSDDMNDELHVNGDCVLRDDKYAVHKTKWRCRYNNDGTVIWNMSCAVSVDEYFRMSERKARRGTKRLFGPACEGGKLGHKRLDDKGDDKGDSNDSSYDESVDDLIESKQKQ